MPPRPQIERKIAIMGYRSVGKSSITLQFTENRFPDSYDPTIANNLDVAAFSKEFEFRGRSYQLHLFDTAGQTLPRFEFRNIHSVWLFFKDEYSLFPRSYSVGVHGYVLVYAINSRKSYVSFPLLISIYANFNLFEVVKVIYDKILDSVGYTGDVSVVPIILVGNKLDLQQVEREVSADEGRKTAEKWKASFLETTAKDNHRIRELFERLLFQVEKAHGNIRDTKESSCILS
ncbi:GTP binding protein Rheb [Trichuris trichiura]|uniref:GTP binding protein Rheb n=1 Tax=Trichuris trichiura TaxID=36087 RepID=A0A077ZKG2_TRITR|nr:GTP binding protein Rheb [Trichuris trichiura]